MGHQIHITATTPRMKTCRRPTVYLVVDATTNEEGGRKYKTVRLRNIATGFETVWSCDLQHKDSKAAWAGFTRAVKANVARDGTCRVRCQSRPDRRKNWEHFTWTPFAPEPRKEDHITDLFSFEEGEEKVGR